MDMDPSSQTWSSSYYLECLEFCGYDQTPVSETSSTDLTFLNSHHHLSDGNSSNSTISNPSSHRDTGMGSFTVKTEVDNWTSEMISFDGSKCITSPSFVIEEQPGKITRTPEQAGHRVMEERKRRNELSKQFLSLSDLVPGLKMMDKTSVLEGAISHMKHLEKRVKDLEEEGKTGKPTIYCYHYENSPPLRKMEVRIRKEDVLIKICCKNWTGFTEEKLTSEMKKIHLTVTKSKFQPFGDNMLAVSAVAKVKVHFCQAEEELANSIRLAILKLINVRRRHRN